MQLLNLDHIAGCCARAVTARLLIGFALSTEGRPYHIGEREVASPQEWTANIRIGS
jgi:hypothetical protein